MATHNNIQLSQTEIEALTIYLEKYNIKFEIIIPFLNYIINNSFSKSDDVFHFFRLYFSELNSLQINALLYIYYNSYLFINNDRKTTIYSSIQRQESDSISDKRPRIKR